MTRHSSPADGPIHDGLKGRRRWFSTLSIVLGVVMTVLANATTYVALPSMARSLGVDAGVTVWVLNLYLLATVVALLPAAALGDSRGHRRVFLSGLSLFAGATLLAALSSDSITISIPGSKSVLHEASVRPSIKRQEQATRAPKAAPVTAS